MLLTNWTAIPGPCIVWHEYSGGMLGFRCMTGNSFPTWNSSCHQSDEDKLRKFGGLVSQFWGHWSMTETSSICTGSVEGSFRIFTQWEATRLLFTQLRNSLWFVGDSEKVKSFRYLRVCLRCCQMWRLQRNILEKAPTSLATGRYIKMQIHSNSDCASAWWSLPVGFDILYLIALNRSKQENTVT